MLCVRYDCIDLWPDEIFIHVMESIYNNNVLLQIMYTISIVNIFFIHFLTIINLPQ